LCYGVAIAVGTFSYLIMEAYGYNPIWRFRKKPNFCVVLHFTIIQRTKSTPHDCKICTPWIWTFYETV